MKLENQVCSLKLAKKLKKLGVKQDGGLFNWWWQVGIKQLTSYNMRNKLISERGISHDKFCRAFTVAELGEMLPVEIWGFNLTTIKVKDGYSVLYQDFKGAYLGTRKKGDYISVDKTEANARAKILIWLIENKLIGGKKSQ